jgi:hypothetical protein
MGYSSDQFYKFSSYEGAGSSLNRKPDDNPEFLWPGKNTPNVFGPGKDTRMQRGFIRGIYPSVINKVSNQSSAKMKQRRLFFQFNPATIERNVSMSTNVTNPLLQPSVNLLQPVPGQAEFSFELLFDRQAEVVSRSYIDSNGDQTKNYFDATIDNYKQSYVTEYGVLADLYVLDTIIGQSISSDMTSFLKDYWSYVDTAIRSSNATKAVDTETADTGNQSTQSSVDFKNWDTNVKNNLGNSAFLAPLPIRIVFSSLFMVEGYVESSSVQFIKFTKNYIPTMCKVTLYVRALYFGFAREKSFVSEAIAQGVSDSQEVIKEDSQLARKAQVLANTAPVFKYSMSTFPTATNNAGLSFKTDFETDSDNNDYTLSGVLNVDSYTSSALSDAVKNGNITWDFTSKIEFYVYSSTFPEFINNVASPVYNGKYGKLLMEDTLKYLKKNGGDISTEEVATNAVQTNDATDPRQNRASFEAKPKFASIPSDSIIQVKITHTTYITYTSQSVGEQRSATSTLEDYFYFNADNSGAVDYEKWYKGDTAFMIQSNASNPSLRN